MPTPYSPDRPDGEEVQLRLMDEHVTLQQFSSYSFESDFLSPSDGFSFTLEDSKLPAGVDKALKIGARVALTINSVRVADGYLDKCVMGADRKSGRTWQLAGRDRLGLAVDSGADPTVKFPEGTTLEQALMSIFTPFGFASPTDFIIDNDANRALSTGGARGIKMSKGGKKRGPKPLKNIVLHLSKPYPHETAYDFAKRLANREGLWIWVQSDGERLVVGRPDFEQDPLYRLRRSLDGSGNVEGGHVSYDRTSQPSVIIADSFGGGGEFGKGRFKAFAVNPYFGVDDDGFVLDEVSKLISKFPDAQQVTFTVQPYHRRAAQIPQRPVWLHDDESKTPAQLEAYLRREMSLLIRQSLTAEYLVTGHGQINDGEFTAWAVDTVVDVQDEVGDLHERMYVLGVHYEKSRQGGTSTRLQLVRLNSLEF